MRKAKLVLLVSLGLALGCGNCGGSGDKAGASSSESPAAGQGPIVELVLTLPDENAATVEMRIIKPYERALRGDEQVKEFWATAVDGKATIFTRYQASVADSLALDLTGRALTRIRRMPEEAGEPVLSIADEVTSLQVRLKSSDMDALIEAVGTVMEQLNQVEGIDSASSSLHTKSSVNIEYNEEKINSLGLRTFGVAHQVSESGLLDGETADLDAIGAILIKTRTGEQVALSELAVVQHSLTAMQLDSVNGKRVAWITVEAADEAAARALLQDLRSPHNAVTISAR